MRIFVTCLGFNRPEIVEGGLKNFNDTVDPQHNIIKTLFNPGYPLPCPRENREKLVRLAAEYGWWFTDIPNKGVAENHNQAIFDYYHPITGDIIVLHDPDVRMEQKGWLPAMVEVLQTYPEAPFVFSNRHYQDEDWCVRQHGRQIFNAPSGARVAKFKELIAWSNGAYRAEWLTEVATREFRAYNDYYGWGEHAMFDLMIKHGKTFYQVVDFYDNHLASESLYTDWKVASAKGETKALFEEWLKEKEPK